MNYHNYLNLDIELKGREGQYFARVQAEDAEAEIPFVLPFSDVEIENIYLRIGNTRRATRRQDAPEVRAIKEFGQRLFDALFVGAARDTLRHGQFVAASQNAALRLRFSFNGAPGLAALPWEYLYDKDKNRFLALSVTSPVVRYLEMGEGVMPLHVSLPLRMLVIIASPMDLAALDTEKEWRSLKTALQELEEQGVLVVERLQPPTLGTLQRTLRLNHFNILHFIGHGAFDESTQDGVLLLSDTNGYSQRVSGENLGTILHDHRTSLRFVMLNACDGGRSASDDPFAGVAQSLIQQGMPAVVAMQSEVTDVSAIGLAREFYGALADGYTIEAALTEARKALFTQPQSIEWGIPVLYSRTSNGQLFTITQAEIPTVARALPHTPQAENASIPLTNPKASPTETASPPAIEKKEKPTVIAKPVFTAPSSGESRESRPSLSAAAPVRDVSTSARSPMPLLYFCEPLVLFLFAYIAYYISPSITNPPLAQYYGPSSWFIFWTVLWGYYLVNTLVYRHFTKTLQPLLMVAIAMGVLLLSTVVIYGAVSMNVPKYTLVWDSYLTLPQFLGVVLVIVFPLLDVHRTLLATILSQITRRKIEPEYFWLGHMRDIRQVVNSFRNR